jgi:peptidyl-prolyl cis-trans isomerase-like protein 2
VIRNTNPQLQSVLSALGTAEAAQAFKAGGGGKRAEAARILAEAKLAAQKKKEEAAAQAQGSKGDKQAAGAAAGAAAAGPAAAGPAGDWRLRAPDKKHEYTIKPGAATWDTDDHITGAGADKKRKAGAAPDADAQPSTSGRPSPQQWWEQHYRVKYQESLQTTGAQSRGFTSTALAPSTKNQRVMKRIGGQRATGNMLLCAHGSCSLCQMCYSSCQALIYLMAHLHAS